MKEVKFYSNYTQEQVTVPTCDTCRFKRETEELVCWATWGRVESCRKGLPLAYPEPCPEYKPKLLTRVLGFLGL